MTKTEVKKPSALISLLIVLFLVVTIVIQVIVLGSPSIRMTLIFAAAFAVVLLMATGTKWKTIEEGILHGAAIATTPNMIMILIGMAIPVLIACGAIPVLIYYGTQIIHPSYFLFTVAIVCAVGSLATGSSWTTGATFGVAFMGISISLGISPAATAGAVISGAIFGDKMSPLSDSTNLAAGVTEANLFDHIKSMLYTTGPAFILSLVIYFVIGLGYSAESIDSAAVDSILTGISTSFNITPLYAIIALIPLVLVLVCGAKQVSAILTMVLVGLVAMIIAMVFQGYGLVDLMGYMDGGFVSTTGVTDVDSLLSRGGISSMMWTVSVALLGLAYGGILEKARVLEVLLEKLGKLTASAKTLIPTHIVTTILLNFLSSSQYMAILIPGRMFVPAYKKLGIAPKVASRTCEDSGTVTSPIVPWGLCGVFFAGVLGVSTLEYAPYTFLAYLTPIIAIIYSSTGLFIFKAEDDSSDTAE